MLCCTTCYNLLVRSPYFAGVGSGAGWWRDGGYQQRKNVWTRKMLYMTSIVFMAASRHFSIVSSGSVGVCRILRVK